MSDKTESQESKDVLLVVGKSEAGYQVLRQRKDRMEAGEVRPLEEGKPVTGDVLELKNRPEHPNLFDVDVKYRHPTGQGPSDSPTRPAQVASKTYRKGWDRVFRNPRPAKQLN
ncbi:MAG: hypothetical protein AAGF12_05385 [Myxococcota bacterium]